MEGIHKNKEPPNNTDINLSLIQKTSTILTEKEEG
jgi:hypothetical protein